MLLTAKPWECVKADLEGLSLETSLNIKYLLVIKDYFFKHIFAVLVQQIDRTFLKHLGPNSQS